MDGVSAAGRPQSAIGRRPASSTRWFYMFMALLITAAVIYGFSQTIEHNLIRPAAPRPGLVYAHGLLFFSWVVLFGVQTGLVQTRHVRVHRQLGLAGLGLGAIIPPVGIATSLVMGRFDIDHRLFGRADSEAFLAIPFNDMICFGSCVALAAWWRRKPDFHRRLMLMATCCLTAAAFARFPFITINVLRWYGGVDLLLLLGVAFDLATTRRIHPVYAYGVPLIVLGQAIAMALYLLSPPAWLALGGRLIG
jgi:hypothetical protein